MIRRIVCTLLLMLSLSSCDRMLRSLRVGKSDSFVDQIQVDSPSKPEIVTAFEAISKAAYEHNRVFLENHDANKPSNELAYGAGIEQLNRSSREHGGLAKQIMDAVTASWLYEKDLFTPFDTIDRQMHGMPTWSSDQALQRRGYIQIIDQTILTYDGAVAYLERGEEPLQQRNFDRLGVPREISGEFFRIQKKARKEIGESQRGMFREQRSALQCYREAMISMDQSKANQHLAQAKQHEQKAAQCKTSMVAEIRKQMKSAGLP